MQYVLLTLNTLYYKRIISIILYLVLIFVKQIKHFPISAKELMVLGMP